MSSKPPPPPFGRSRSPAIAGAEGNEAPNLFADGKAYERLMGRWSKIAGEQFIDWLAPPAGLRWVDVGCGNGAFTEVLIAKTAPAAVTGIDPSEGQLSYARSRPGTRTAEFRIGGAQDLPFGDDSFDAASMALVISFLPDPVKAAAEMSRVVKPGGIVATYMWDAPGGGFPLNPIAVAMESLGMTAPSTPYPDSSRQDFMRAFWAKAGLQLIETRAITVPIVYADFDDFWDSNYAPVGSFGTAVVALPSPEKERLKARLREMLPADGAGRIAYEAFANAVKGHVPS
jgi:ubiquinone/menaquinone biosynthesis C-methylase UbiE